MNGKFLALGSTLAAFIASLCCLGPLLLGGIGLGAVLVATFAPLRPYFLTVSALLLALGFYFVYRKPKPAEACAGEVCVMESPARRWAQPLLWLATLAVAALALFPYYGGGTGSDCLVQHNHGGDGTRNGGVEHRGDGLRSLRWRGEGQVAGNAWCGRS
jgi:mercuric ion transport protein